MLDRDILRRQPELVTRMLESRGEDVGVVADFTKIEKKWLAALQKYEKLRSEQNKRSKAGKPTEAELKAAKKTKTELSGLGQEVNELDQQCQAILARIPNLLLEDVPLGNGETANSVITQRGTIHVKKGKNHEQLMIQPGINKTSIDLVAAAKFSGSRFRYLLNDAALAHLSLAHDSFRFAIKHGFRPVIPPVLTRGQTLHNAGWFPMAIEDTYKLADEDLYLTGTSEQTLLALTADQTFDEADLPIRLVGFSSCFRKEAGSYGKDVEGMFRQHQFDKVEMVSVTTPEQSADEHERLVALESKLVESYDLPYQLVMIGSGDLGPTAAKKIDIETWFPGQERYRETHSASNCTDYQARRFRIKVRRKDGSEVLAHTLNATLATERLLLAIIENNQRPDGTFRLPRRLR